MTELLQVDFKAKKLIKKSVLGTLVVDKNYTCYGCGSEYNTDKSSGGYCAYVSIKVGKHNIPLCRHCIDNAHNALKGETV